MSCDFPKWWAFLAYDGFKYHVNVTEGFEKFMEEWIMVGKEEDGTSAFNQSYDKLKAKQDKTQKVVQWLATTANSTTSYLP